MKDVLRSLTSCCLFLFYVSFIAGQNNTTGYAWSKWLCSSWWRSMSEIHSVGLCFCQKKMSIKDLRDHSLIWSKLFPVPVALLSKTWAVLNTTQPYKHVIFNLITTLLSSLSRLHLNVVIVMGLTCFNQVITTGCFYSLFLGRPVNSSLWLVTGQGSPSTVMQTLI